MSEFPNQPMKPIETMTAKEMSEELTVLRGGRTERRAKATSTTKKKTKNAKIKEYTKYIQSKPVEDLPVLAETIGCTLEEITKIHNQK